MTRIGRRRLLKLGASAAAGASAPSWLAGCGGDKSGDPVGPAPSVSAPPPTSEPPAAFCQTSSGTRRARVAAARGTELAAMTREVLARLGGIESVVHPGETVFVKPNMVTLPWAGPSYDPFRLGECTKPEIAIAVAEECLRVGASEVTIGDGSQMPRFDWSRAVTLDGSTNLVRAASDLSARYRRPVRLACLDVDTPEWIEFPTSTSLRRVAVSSLVARADRVISIPVAKSHRWARLTLSLKNFVGITPLERYGWATSSDHSRVDLHRNDADLQGFTRLTLDLVQAVRPDLAIIDLSIGMEGNGPSSSLGGTPVDLRSRLGFWVLLASTDLVAADATAARMLGHEGIYTEPVLGLAVQAGLGVACESQIDLVGATAADLRVSWLPATPAN
jgi:uncharacterized protein (DUF362 family)